MVTIMNIGEAKAKCLIERILKDLSKRCNANLAIEKRSKNLKLFNGRMVDTLFIVYKFESEYGPSFMPILYIIDNVTYTKLLNKLLKEGISMPFCNDERLYIQKLYGSTYEEIMMNLDMNSVEWKSRSLFDINKY